MEPGRQLSRRPLLLSQETTIRHETPGILSDLALQSPTCAADPSPLMGSEGSKLELLCTGERTRQRPLAECSVRLTQRMKKEGGKRDVMLVFMAS